MAETGIRLLASGLALFPVVLIVLYAVARGRGRTDGEFVGIAVALGACVALAALGVVIFVGLGIQAMPNPYGKGFARALFVAALPEETAKFLLLVFVLMRHEECKTPADIMIASVCIGLGFAGLENLLYVVGNEQWLAVGWMRALSAVPLHAAAGMVMGYFAVKSRMTDGTARRGLAMGWAMAIACHAAYDAPIMIITELALVRDRIPADALEIQLILLFVAVVFVMLAGAIVGLLSLEKALATLPREVEPMDPAGRTGILYRGTTWKTAGVAFAISAVGLVILLPLLHEGLPRWIAVPYVFFPAIFGFSMFRYGRQLSLDAASEPPKVSA